MQHQDQMVTVNNLVAKVGIHIILGEVQAHQVHIYPVIQRLGCLLESVQSLLYYQQAMLQLLPLCRSILLPLHLDSLLFLYLSILHSLHLDTLLLGHLPTPYDSGSWKIICVTSHQVGLLRNNGYHPRLFSGFAKNG